MSNTELRTIIGDLRNNEPFNNAKYVDCSEAMAKVNFYRSQMETLLKLIPAE